MKVLLLIVVISALNLQSQAQSDNSHTHMINLITQQLPTLISDNFVSEFNSNIRPKLIAEFTSAIDTYQSDFLNSIYEYLKPIIIALIVLACVQVLLSFVIIVTIVTFCMWSRCYIKRVSING